MSLVRSRGEFRVALVLLSFFGFSAGANPLNEAWYLSRARANMKIHNYKAAIEAYEKLLEVAPKNREGMKDLGLAYEKQGQTDKAIAQYDRYLGEYKDDPEVAFKLAHYLEWSRYGYRRGDAIALYRQGLKSEPKNGAMRWRLAKLLAQDKKNLDDAVTEYETLLAERPEDAKLREEYRKLLLWDHHYVDKAIIEQKKVVDARPGDWKTQYQLAKLLAESPEHRSEAIELYHKLVTERPGDLKARLELARLYTAAKDRDHAEEQFAILAKHEPSLGVQMEYADMLASSKSTRGDAMGEYRRIIARAPGNTEARLRYARLLSAEKETVKDAIPQYEAVLNKDPSNAEATNGLAKAYAWLGKNDQARYYVAQSEDRRPDYSGEMHALDANLRVGSEPAAGAFFQIDRHPSDEYALSGIAWGARARTELSSRFSGQLEGGWERYSAGGDQVSAPFAEAKIGMILLPELSLEGNAGIHPLLDASQGWVGGGEAKVMLSDYTLRMGFQHDIKRDSLFSMVGQLTGTTKIGAARSNLVFGELKTKWGIFDVSANPYLGWVTTAFNGQNGFGGLDTRAETALIEAHGFRLLGSFRLSGEHYAEDYSGFSISPTGPLPGGYFSPQLFLEGAPALGMEYRAGARHAFSLRGGPALQYVKSTDVDAAIRFGSEAQLSYLGRFGHDFGLELAGEYINISDVYSALSGSAFVTYLF